MLTTHIPPSTGKKSKARRVFGEAAADDFDISLTYSPSPNVSSDDTNERRIASIDEKYISDKVALLPVVVPLSSTTEYSTSKDKENTKNVRFSTTATNAKANTTFHERDSNMRIFSRSPVRPDLVKKTQDAINKANVSMENFSQAITLARQAKTDYNNYVRKETSKIRKDWKDDTIEAKTLSELTEQNRRNFLSLQRQFSSKYSKEKARREQSKRIDALNNIEREIEFKSEVFRDHQLKLKQDKANRRRLSTEVRSKIRTNNRLGTEKMKLEKIQENQAVFHERHAASTALRVAKTQDNLLRRQSFAFRNGDARRIRQLHANLQEKLHQQKHENFELKWQAEQDVKTHVSKELQARRDSLANRNARCRDVRKLEREMHQKMLIAEHNSYELNREAEKDARNFVRSQEEEHRTSLVQRNKEGKRQRDFLQHQHAKEVSNALASFELNWAAENDADAYRCKLIQAHRDSLAFRNMVGRQQRYAAQKEQFDLARKTHESYELRWAGERDAAAYITNIKTERRKSITDRNVDARRQRAWMQQQQVEASDREHESFELKMAAAKDADEFLLRQEQVRRESLRSRNKERAEHAKVLEELRMLALEKESESFALKWAGELDANEYLSKLEEESRLSLQLSGQQTLHNRQIDNEMRTEQLLKSHETEALRAIDKREIETYVKQCAERDRISLEFRRKDARIQRIQNEEASRKLREQDNQSHQLETLALVDVENYVNDCKIRRRMSLACRAKENRKQAEWLRKKKDRLLKEQSRSVHYQLMDQKFIELAQQKERARLALNAMRHAGYTF